MSTIWLRLRGRNIVYIEKNNEIIHEKIFNHFKNVYLYRVNRSLWCFLCTKGPEPYHIRGCARYVDDSGRGYLLYEQYHDAYESGSATHEIQRSRQLGADWLWPRVVGGHGRVEPR